MLASIRKIASGKFAGIFLGVISVTFALWGINGSFGGGADTYAARITLKPGWFGTSIGAKYKDIPVQDFRDALNRARRQQRQMLGDRFDPDQFESIANKREVMDQLVQRDLLLEAANDDGLKVTDDQIRKMILAMPEFQVNGKFDLARYQALLAEQQPPMTGAQFEAGRRQDQLVATLPTELLASGISSDRDVDQFVRLRRQTRDLRYLDVVAHDPATPPTEAELQAWYKAHLADYRSPEQVSLEYLEVDAANVKAPTRIDDATLRARYDEQKNRYVEPEQRQASHILIEVPAGASAAVDKAAQAKAAALAAQARAPGADFAALAKANSQDAGSKNLGGDLGWLTQKVIDQKAFADALFALKPGQISDPVRSDQGWHVIWLRDVRPGRQIPFETVRADLEKAELKDQREKAYNDLTGKLVDITLKDPTSLAPAARELGLTIQKTPLFGRSGGPGIAANAKVIKAAFSSSVLDDGNTSDPIDLGDKPDHMVVIRVAEHLPVKTLAYAQVHDRVLADVQADRRAKAAKGMADGLLARAAKGESLDVLAAPASTVQGADGVMRDATSLPKPLLDAAFRLPHPAQGKPLQTGLAQIAPDHYVLVQVTRVTDGDPKQLDADTRERLRTQAAQARAALETKAYVDALKRKFPVKVAEDRL